MIIFVRLNQIKLHAYFNSLTDNIWFLCFNHPIFSKRMYDNVLKSNWDQLKFCTFIGNSFQSYLLHSTASSLTNQVSF